MENQKPAIIFDVGGVLLDWNPRYLFRKLFNGDEVRMEDFLTRVCSLAWCLRIDEGQPFPEAVEELSHQHPEYATFIHLYYDRWEEMIGEPFTANIELLHALARKGYPVYALTNFPTDKFEFTRNRFDFFRIFQEIVVSADVKLAKPDPRIYELMLRRIGRQAKECIFIDDTARNVDSARTLGLRAILHQSPTQLRVDLANAGVSWNGDLR
jgi:2-haloacid dehalogenase